MAYGADTDGVDHINVNSIGKTLLGMMLYNGSFSPMTISEFGSFTSIYGFIGWLVTGRQYDVFRYLYGQDALAKIKGLPIVRDQELHDLIKKAILLKLDQNMTLRHLFYMNKKLPYVSYGDVNRDYLIGILDEWIDDDCWTLDFFTYLQHGNAIQ